MDAQGQAEPLDRFYRRHLPHWQPPAGRLFVTWRLHGSLPRSALDRLEAERRALDRQPERPAETPRDRALRHNKGLFHLADSLLGQQVAGPRWLADDSIGRLMVDALFHHHGHLYNLLAFVVMPNHVHVLLQPLELPQAAGVSAPVPLSRITQSLKGFVAREANRLLARTGQRFWQDESYDHWVRDDAEMGRVARYIEGDPVRSGLVGTVLDWRWSSAWERAYGRLRDGCGQPGH